MPTASHRDRKRCTDCFHQTLGRDIARYFKQLTGLELHLRQETDESPSCPEAERLRALRAAIPSRCAICAEQVWQHAIHSKTGSRVFAGACGRENCWLSIKAADGYTLSLLVQTPPPQPGERQSSGVLLSPSIHRPDARKARIDCPPVTEAFGRAVILLKIVARGLEAALEAEELKGALDENRRFLEAVLAHDTRLRRVLKRFLPEIPDEPVTPEDMPHTSRMIQQVRDFLLQNYHSPLIGLSEAAAQVHRSASYLSMLFARETGVSFHSYLQELRLAKAKELLHDPRLTVDEIAQACGYASAGWFRHSFKHHVGFSPSDWRRSRLHS